VAGGGVVLDRHLLHGHIGWVLAYSITSPFRKPVGFDTEAFFTGQFLGVSDSFWSVGGSSSGIDTLDAWAIVLVADTRRRPCIELASTLIPLMAL